MKINILLKELIEQKSVPYHSIINRVKEKDSLGEKIDSKNKYKSLDEITDIVGCRIITYFEDDVEKIVNLISEEFAIDIENSIDKKKMLDPEKFGYISYHIVCSINTQRGKLIEYTNYKTIKFEIQIRTILQHAWAEIEHNIGYKTEVQVPSEFRRKFSRLAGMLEIVDDEFTRLKNGIEDYVQELSEKGLNNTDINSESMKIFIEKSRDIDDISTYIKNTFNFNNYELSDDENNDLILWMINHINKYTDFKTIDKLEIAIKNHKKIIEIFTKMWIEANPKVKERLDNTGVSYSFIGIYYYILILLLESNKKDNLIEIFTNNGQDENEDEDDINKRIDLAFKIYNKAIKLKV